MTRRIDPHLHFEGLVGDGDVRLDLGDGAVHLVHAGRGLLGGEGERAETRQELAAALNTLGVSPQDLIAIFQAIKAAGALQADLEVI